MKLVCRLYDDGFEVKEGRVIDLNCKKMFKYTFWKQNNDILNFIKTKQLICYIYHWRCLLQID